MLEGSWTEEMSNRADRRQKQRNAKKYDATETFTKQQVEVMNERSYDLGVQHAVQAMKEEFGIGPKREKLFEERLRWIQYQVFTLSMQDVNVK